MHAEEITFSVIINSSMVRTRPERVAWQFRELEFSQQLVETQKINDFERVWMKLIFCLFVHQLRSHVSNEDAYERLCLTARVFKSDARTEAFEGTP